MSAFRRSLPARADLEHQKKLAKELVAAFRRGDARAHARIRAELPDKQRIVLADGQYIIAREYGFASWRELKDRIESLAVERLSPIDDFRKAVRDGDSRTLRRLLESHHELRAAVNEPMFAFDSPALVSVAGNGDVDMVDVLLEFGADPNRRSSWWAGGFHPLYSAHDAVADRLLAAGAIPDACSAAHLDRPDILLRLLAEDPSRVNERGGDGQTPLHFARSRRVADLLLEAGADIDAVDIDHRSTPAQWMIGADGPKRPRAEIAKYLVERGASVDIFLTAALGLADRARRLLDANPSLLSLRTSQGEYGEKPPGSYHIYQWTIGPNVTPLHVATHFGQRETLEVMRGYASPEQRLLLAYHDGDGNEAQAIVRSHVGILGRLSHADPRALTDEAWMGNAPAVELMLELGFDPAATGVDGGTALHCAAWQGSVACVAALLRNSAGRSLIGARDTTHNGTPLGWCCHGSLNCGNPRADHAEVARLLLEAGAALPVAGAEASDAVQAVIDAARHGR